MGNATKVRILYRMAAAVGAACLSVTVTAGIAAAQTMPAGPAPGYHQASSVGSCHGIFGDYFGTLLSSTPGGFSSLAPLRNTNGKNNAVGSCPYQGVSAPVFPPRS